MQFGVWGHLGDVIQLDSRRGELASPNGQDWRPRFGDAPRDDTGAVGAEERSAEDEP